MSEPRLLICGPAINAAESTRCLAMMRGIDTPNATKFVITTGKFDAEQAASTFNIEASYPAEIAELQTLARAAEPEGAGKQCFRDAYDLYCLRRLVEERKGFEFAVLMRSAAGFDELWPGLHSRVKGELFLTFAPQPVDETGLIATNLVIDLTDERAGPFLDRIGEVYGSGASYSIAGYSLDAGLHVAFEAMGLEETITDFMKGPSAAQAQSDWFGRPRSGRPAVLPSEPAVLGR